MSWSARPTAPFTLNVQFGADDYRRYFAVVGRRQQSSWLTFSIFVGALFSAILVGFAFRSLASLETSDRVAIEIAGRYSLFAYAVGVYVFLGLALFMRRRSLFNAVASTPHAFDPKTIVLDDDAVSITGILSNTRYTWRAFSQVTVARGLLFLWIGSQTAVVIPEHAFATDEIRKSAIAFVETNA
jgi:hypothetical protein